MSLLDPLFEGIVSTAFGTLIWTALGVWAIVSIIIYLPLKRLRAQRTELENVWPEVLGELAENLRAGMGVESALDALAAARGEEASIFRLEGAGHTFGVRHPMTESASAFEEVWARTRAFLDEHLGTTA